MTEVYVSSAIVKFDRIEDSVTNLAENGFKNIELSGGTNYTPHSEVIESLLRIKNKYGLNYLLHNYFPTPKVPFILNLATNQEDISKSNRESSFKLS